MAKQAGNAKDSNEGKGKRVYKNNPRHSPEQKAEIVRSINRMWSDGHKIEDACFAHNISHKTHWVWRNETAELSQDYKTACIERHQVREDRIKELTFSAFERALMSEVRERTIREGAEDDNGVFKAKKIVKFQEFKDPTWNAIKTGLETYYPEQFKKEDGPQEMVITFTDDAKHGFNDPGEPDSE